MNHVDRAKARASHIRRRNWMMWGSTFALVLALCAAVPMLYLPLLQSLSQYDPSQSTSRENAYYAIIGITGLVLIFCLYLVLKQRELERLRNSLHQETQESEHVRTRLLELSAMFQLATTLNLQLRLQVVLEIIVRRVVSALRAQQASIMLYDAESGELETRASYGLEAEYAQSARVRMGEDIAGRVAERGQSVLLNPAASDPEYERHFRPERNISSALSLPLRMGERCIGVLNVNRIDHPELFEDHHKEVLAMFAEHVAAVIERAETLDRLGLRSRELEVANVKLTQLNAMKDVFLSTASHELKTPLTSVIAYAELLEEQESKLTVDQRGEFLRRLRTEADQLMGLIEDILDLTRLESGKLTLKPTEVEIIPVAQSAVETVRALADKHEIKIRESYEAGLPALPLDEVKIRQVVTNLLVNSIKFSPTRGSVVIRLAREPRWVRIDVTDQGPGIGAEEAQHLFELFRQGAPEGQRPSAGVGIGLHLVKRITELHGGCVGVHSVPGQGSTFWVRLPITPARSKEPEEVEQRAA